MKPSQNGRDQYGRFAPGNAGGPGNPHGGTVERLRHALLGAVTEADLQAIGAALVAQAKAGDLPAVKELLNRVLGRPTDSDTLARLERLEAAMLGSETGGGQ
jgi:hypothetical protein